jgi:hypothetical protein
MLVGVREQLLFELFATLAVWRADVRSILVMRAQIYSAVSSGGHIVVSVRVCEMSVRERGSGSAGDVVSVSSS